MKKVLTFAILIFASVLTFACKDGAKAQPNEPEQKEAKSGEVIVMNKDMYSITRNPRTGNIRVTNPPSLIYMPTGVVPAA